jgi:hypothetical protein
MRTFEAIWGFTSAVHHFVLSRNTLDQIACHITGTIQERNERTDTFGKPSASTTDSVSHNGGDLRIRLPEPENPLKHFFITNLFDIPQVPVPVLRETRQLGLPYLENPLKHFFVTNLLYICNRVVGPDTTTDSVSHKGDPLGIGLPYLENPLKHFFITNLLYSAIGSAVQIPPPIRCSTTAATSESDSPNPKTL